MIESKTDLRPHFLHGSAGPSVPLPGEGERPDDPSAGDPGRRVPPSPVKDLVARRRWRRFGWVGALSILLAGYEPVLGAEEIELECRGMNEAAPLKLVLDLGQRAVVQDGKAGNIAMISDEYIYYFLKIRGRAQANRLTRRDGTLRQAISKKEPDVGYDQYELRCRRTP